MFRIPILRKAITSDKTAAFSVTMVIAALGAATAIRWALSTIGANLTFVTYFPAVLICTLLTGWRYGAGCGVLSGIAGASLFPNRAGASPLELGSIINVVVFLMSAAVIIATADALRRAVRSLDEANRTAEVLNRELQHRVGNMLTVVQGIASQTARGSDPSQFLTAFTGRLQALNKANALLGKRSLDSCALPDLIDEACAPFCKGENLIKQGPACLLPSASCVPLVLALHELCTNAVKYGALSTPEGKVRVSWTLAEHQLLTILWQEQGGPPVVNPSRRGFGSKLLQPQPGITELDLNFDPDGVRCEFKVDGAETLERPTSRKVGLSSLEPGTVG